MKASKLVLLFCLISFFSYARWEEITTNSSENLTSIEFIGNTGFCAGENGELLKSTNSGQTWNLITSGTIDNITSILFLDVNTGYFSTSTGFVFKTTDGGVSWTNNKLQSIGAINGIDFLNNSIGLAVGDNGAIFRTSDGGTSWNSLGNVSVYVVNDVTFVNDTLAVTVGAQGSVLSSSDAGLTWDWKAITSSNTFTSIEKLNDSTAAMVGSAGLYSEFSSISMLASNEQTIDPDLTPDLLKDIHLSPSGNLYVVGFNQTVLITNPSWKTWDLDSVNNLNGIHFFNDTIGFACGANGKIYKTISGGFPVGKNEVKLNKLNLYPNPASNIINFVGLENEENKLFIYNQSGQLITNTTIQQTQYNIENFKTGLYFIHIIGVNHTYRGKFIKR
tara:strand:+ start:375 stop:1544 length:1170 start_codon:yes stop_codon:yes gene_type:complete